MRRNDPTPHSPTPIRILAVHHAAQMQILGRNGSPVRRVAALKPRPPPAADHPDGNTQRAQRGEERKEGRDFLPILCALCCFDFVASISLWDHEPACRVERCPSQPASPLTPRRRSVVLAVHGARPQKQFPSRHNFEFCRAWAILQRFFDIESRQQCGRNGPGAAIPAINRSPACGPFDRLGTSYTEQAESR